MNDCWNGSEWDKQLAKKILTASVTGIYLDQLMGQLIVKVSRLAGGCSLYNIINKSIHLSLIKWSKARQTELDWAFTVTVFYIVIFADYLPDFSTFYAPRFALKTNENSVMKGPKSLHLTGVHVHHFKEQACADMCT